MHKRRVGGSALEGKQPVQVCTVCHDAFWAKDPSLSKFSLANCLWLGRHPPLFRNAPIGHQLLLALGRVVSTKVYLSSKGVDETSRVAQNSWRHKFLQQGISGNSIVYGNGDINHAMNSFPPSQEVLQETFIAVFTGAETQPVQPLTEEQQEASARAALSRELELQIEGRFRCAS